MSSELSTSAPKPSEWDYAYAVFKGAVSAIPFAGGAAAEVFTLLVASPMSKRNEEWIISIVQALVNLQEKIEGYKLDSLSENASFVTTVLHASQIAIRNHQKEKLEALRNAVLNSTLPGCPEDNFQQTFLRFIDELTPVHLQIIKLLNEIRITYEKYTAEDKAGFIYDITDLQKFLGRVNQSDVELFQLVFKDLESNRLANIHGLGNTGFHINFAMSRLTKLGEMFFNFVATPDVLKE